MVYHAPNPQQTGPMYPTLAPSPYEVLGVVPPAATLVPTAPVPVMPSAGQKVATNPDLWTARDFKLKATFVPAKVAAGGAQQYAITIPLSDMIRPDWLTSTEMPLDGRTKIGKVKLWNFYTTYFADVSGRFFVPDTRLKIAGTPGGQTKADRLNGDVAILGSRNLAQFTICQNSLISDKEVQLRDNPTEHNVSFLEGIGQGHLTEDDLWEQVEKTPGTLETSSDKIAHIDSAVGQYAKKLWNEKLMYQDTAHRMIKLRQDDAEAIISRLVTDRYENMTLEQVYEDGYFEFYLTHADIAKLQDSGKKMSSPWMYVGTDLDGIEDDETRESEKMKRLHKSYDIFITMTLGMMPVLRDLGPV